MNLHKCAHYFAGVSFKSYAPYTKPELLDLVHSDVYDPIKTKPLGDASYFVYSLMIIRGSYEFFA